MQTCSKPDPHDILIHYAMMQVSLKKGIKLYGDDAQVGLQDEFSQLHTMKTFIPNHAHELSNTQQKKALKMLMFIKQKRCSKIKGRGVVDGRSQRAYILKDAASPTAALELVILSYVCI